MVKIIRYISQIEKLQDEALLALETKGETPEVIQLWEKNEKMVDKLIQWTAQDQNLKLETNQKS